MVLYFINNDFNQELFKGYTKFDEILFTVWDHAVFLSITVFNCLFRKNIK